MQRAGRCAEREQRVVGEREERAAQRGEHRQLVVGPLDRGERVAQRLDLLALVERAAADQDVRRGGAPRARARRPRDVAAEGAEAPEEQADVARLDRHARSGRSRSVTVQPLSLDQPVDERADRVGQRLVDLPVGDVAAVVAVGRGHRQRDQRRLRRAVARETASAAT